MKEFLKYITTPLHSIAELPFVLFGMLVAVSQYDVGNYLQGAVGCFIICTVGILINKMLKSISQ